MELAGCVVVVAAGGVAERVVCVVDALELLGACWSFGRVDGDAIWM